MRGGKRVGGQDERGFFGNGKFKWPEGYPTRLLCRDQNLRRKVRVRQIKHIGSNLNKTSPMRKSSLEMEITHKSITLRSEVCIDTLPNGD